MLHIPLEVIWPDMSIRRDLTKSLLEGYKVSHAICVLTSPVGMY